ncbi:MAG: hypothetical protein K9G67_07095 [Bacteroidales bacterium]|nr:hypothetical protein [Bacteroidales bacterium]MCF8352249.1 hypothetical protein [Bacteroidales bacterium]MCF8376107.1 hypothetical protein [Bacteroidales bacterium]MCF8401420.1 hypothetical protein [Bacteroidales bacterium]
MKNWLTFLYPALFALMTIILIQSCKQDDDEDINVPPTASFTVTPDSGTTETLFKFDASASHDNETPLDALQVRWDFDGDGSWDTDWSVEKLNSHLYAEAAEYDVELEVKDNEGLAATDVHTVLVAESNPQGTFVDPRDGQTYNTIKIGNQVWFAENLNYEAENSFCYEVNPAYCDTYGRLYTWAAIMDGGSSSNEVPSGVQGICPEGWHIPSDAEWMILSEFTGGSSGAGVKLKSASGWYAGGHGTDEFGFTALPAGLCRPDQPLEFIEMKHSANFWTCTEDDAWRAYRWNLRYNSDADNRGWTSKELGLSVRCVKN